MSNSLDPNETPSVYSASHSDPSCLPMVLSRGVGFTEYASYGREKSVPCGNSVIIVVHEFTLASSLPRQLCARPLLL